MVFSVFEWDYSVKGRGYELFYTVTRIRYVIELPSELNNILYTFMYSGLKAFPRK